MTQPGPVEDGRVLSERYRLVTRLAAGGMAEVWEGLDEVLTRPVAIKLLHPHLSADVRFRERFRREAIAAARLAHPHIVATFDTGEDGDTAYIVMELIRGRTLRELLAEGPLPASTAATLGVQVAEALHHAHEQGLVHRDVKPANILVCDGDRDAPLRVKVADFGIARAAADDGADLTQPGTLLGTAKYLAPEQIEGHAPDARSDIYSLGVVLYEALTGRPPFVADTEMATALARVATEPLKPRQLRAGIPRGFEAVVLRAMARSPADRFDSAAELAIALRGLDLAEDDATPAVVRDPTPPAGVTGSFRQTERTWIVPAVVIVAAAVALTVIGIVFSRSDVGQQILGKKETTTTVAGAALPLAAEHSFDPQGTDGSENEPRVRLAFDGDPSTAWATDTYRSAVFGNLKQGVGLVVQLAGPASLTRLHVDSPTRGWSASVYVAEQPGGRLADWGDPVVGAEGVDGGHEFDLGSRRGQAVLLWITRLDSTGRFEASEVSVQGTATP